MLQAKEIEYTGFPFVIITQETLDNVKPVYDFYKEIEALLNSIISMFNRYLIFPKYRNAVKKYMNIN